jgi:hypothetical protein
MNGAGEQPFASAEALQLRKWAISAAFTVAAAAGPVPAAAVAACRTPSDKLHTPLCVRFSLCVYAMLSPSIVQRPADQNLLVRKQPLNAEPRQVARAHSGLGRQGVKRRTPVRHELDFKPRSVFHAEHGTDAARCGNAL